MGWDKTKIVRDNGEVVDAQAPVIVSASRSTDIPAFYADWFFNRLKKGYSAWTNPFNGVQSYVSYEKTRFIVFWSKNPKKLIPHLDYLKERGINCYIQYTLNDYEEEGLEKGVPPLADRIETFKELVLKLGLGHVIWRFDPLILTDRITVDKLLGKVENIGNLLNGYSEKLVFSFADILEYRKVKNNLETNKINYQLFTEETMRQFAAELSKLNEKWGYSLATCAERINLEEYHIKANHCIDEELIARIAYNDSVLMKFLGMEVVSHFGKEFGAVIPEGAIEISDTMYVLRKKDNKDKGQRQFCGCIISKDIGQYNTCPHLCDYCYANTSKAVAVRNWKSHNPNSESILGDSKE